MKVILLLHAVYATAVYKGELEIDNRVGVDPREVVENLAIDSGVALVSAATSSRYNTGDNSFSVDCTDQGSARVALAGVLAPVKKVVVIAIGHAGAKLVGLLSALSEHSVCITVSAGENVDTNGL